MHSTQPSWYLPADMIYIGLLLSWALMAPWHEGVGIDPSFEVLGQLCTVNFANKESLGAGGRVTTPADDKSFVQQAKEGIAAAAAVTAEKASQAYQ